MNNRFGNDRERHGDFGSFNRNERSGPRRHEDERSGWGRGEEGEGSGWGGRHMAQSREPQFSSDYDETYGSEWQRGGDQPRGAFQQGRERGQGSLRQRGQGSYGQGSPEPGSYGQGSYGQGSYGQGSYGQREESRPGWYARGQAGMYGGGSGGGYQGGHGGGGYGGSSGTDYSGESAGYGSQGGYGNQGGYGGQGSNFGAGSYGSGGSWGRSSGQDLRSRDFGGSGGNSRSSQRGAFAGRGPKGYTRTDERIREDVCDRLSMDDDVDASEIEVRVKDGEVTLEGSVQTRSMKHQAEDLVEDVPGVKDVHNHLRVMKGLLNELKDKVSGHEEHGHYANTGTKGTAGASSGQTVANGRS